MIVINIYAALPFRGGPTTANLRTKILDFRGLDSSSSSRILSCEGWNSQAHKEFPGKLESNNIRRDMHIIKTTYVYQVLHQNINNHLIIHISIIIIIIIIIIVIIIITTT